MGWAQRNHVWRNTALMLCTKCSLLVTRSTTCKKRLQKVFCGHLWGAEGLLKDTVHCFAQVLTHQLVSLGKKVSHHLNGWNQYNFVAFWFHLWVHVVLKWSIGHEDFTMNRSNNYINICHAGHVVSVVSRQFILWSLNKNWYFQRLLWWFCISLSNCSVNNFSDYFPPPQKYIFK